MPNSRSDVVKRLFEALSRRDIDTALALTTDDVLLDRSGSKGPFRGAQRGHEAIRAATEDFREPLGEMSWEPEEIRPVGRNYLALGTEVAIVGRSSRINVVAHGGWLVRFEGDRIAEGVLHQSFDDALLGARRRALLDARLYFVCEAQPAGADPAHLLRAAIAGGVDVIQMREKAPRCAEELISFSLPFARAARDQGALFFLNDEPGLVEQCGADGVHVGQDDDPVASARALAGPTALVGLSTHSPEQFDAAIGAVGDSRSDQISAGPVWETPTKAGRPAAGIELVEHAARVASDDAAWFAIGGIDASNIDEIVRAGAKRAVVVRAIRDAPDPAAAARELRAALGAGVAV